MSVGCYECGNVIPDEMGYATLFYSGTDNKIVLPQRGSSQCSWRSVPPNTHICRKKLVRLPKELLKDKPEGIEGIVYSLQSDSNDVHHLLFDEQGRTSVDYNRLTNTFRFLSEKDAKTYFPKSVAFIEDSFR